MRWGRSWGSGSAWGGFPRSASHALDLVQTEGSVLVIPVGFSISEKIESRTLEHTSAGRVLTRIFTILGTDDPVQARSLGPQIGDTYDGGVGDSGDSFTDATLIVSRREYSIIAVDVPTMALELTVTYGEADRTPSGMNRQVRVSFGGRTQHIERAFEQVHYGTGDLEAEWGHNIGPRTKEGNLKGVDRVDTVLTRQETHFRSRFEPSFERTLAEMHGKVNKSAFRGYPPKTVLFEGCEVTTIENGQWQLDYKFAIAIFSVTKAYEFIDENGNPGSANITVAGWEYVWGQPIEAKDATTELLKKSFKSVHVATVYEETEFSALEIGTAPLT